MDWATWEPAYRAILSQFDWDESADATAAKMLYDVLNGRSAWRDVGTELKNRRSAVIVGCGPQLDNLQPADLPTGIIVAADGATARLREIGVVPRVVVTDLDGDMDALTWASEQGSSIVVHAHGDNQDRLPATSALGSFVAGTYQSTPDASLAPLRNLGGFTDGDRAVLLCEHYRVRQVHLVAFDTKGNPSRYSHTWNAQTKGAKLAWCARVIDQARARGLLVSGTY